MRKILIGIAVAAVAGAGAAYYGLAVYPQQRFRSELDQAIQRLPAGYTASYTGADYAVAANRATVTGVKVSHAAPDAFELTIDEIAIVKPALDFGKKWAEAAANPAALTPELALPLGDSVSAKGAALTMTNASFSIESWRVEGPRIYPWAVLHPGIPSWAEAQAAAQRQPPKIEDALPMLKLEAAIMLGMGYDSAEMSNFKTSVSVPATPTVPAMTVSYGFGKTNAERFDRGVGDGLFSVAGIKGTADKFGAFAADRIGMSKIDMRQPAMQLLEGKPPSAALLDGLAIGRIEYVGMSMTPTGGSTMPLGTFSVSKIGFSHGVPISGEIAYDGLRLSRGQIPLPQLVGAYQLLGIDTATLSLGIAYSWDLDAKRLSFRDVALKIDELGALDLSLDASDVSADDIMQMKARLAHAKLRYADGSLAERALRAYARQTGTNPPALREQLIGAVQQQGAAFADSPAITAALKAIAAFIADPKSLTVELSPPTPLNPAILRGAAAIPPPTLGTMLGLTVVANQ